MDSTLRCLALAIMTKGNDKLSSSEIGYYAKFFGVTTRSIYRYLEKIGRANFYIKDATISNTK